MHRLRDLARRCSGRSAEPAAAPVDSRSVRTTGSGGPRGHHAGRKVKKRHLIVDAGGTPVVMTVHTADIQDRDGAPDLIAELLETVPTVCRPFADGGHPGPKLRERPGGMGQCRRLSKDYERLCGNPPASGVRHHAPPVRA